MPIYEYRCASCGFEKEYLQKVSDPRLTVCPECGKPTFDKLVSAAGFQLKGSGWYVTDFKGNGSRPSGDKDKAGGDKEKPAETKPAEPKSDGKADAAGAGASTGPT
jgi:putative FmdB family regulatory protein